MAIYIGIRNVPVPIKNLYVGIRDVPAQVRKVYLGIRNVPVPVWEAPRTEANEEEGT